MTVNQQTEPGSLDRLRTRYGWLDHLIRAFLHFRACNGNLFAAGLTYYTLVALFPLLMIAFAVGGFALSRRPQLVTAIDERTRSWVSPELGQQLVTLMNSAISAHTSVGVIGLIFALWMGQIWMYRLREALCRIWGHPMAPLGFVRTMVSDVAAVLATFAVVVATMTLAALANAEPIKMVLNLFDIPELSVFHWLFRTISMVISFLVSWLVFSWVIVRLPRESVGVATAMRAGLMAAVGFELFKMVGSLYLRMVLRSVAGATFGPLLGLLVFAYVTWVLVLYSTAWAATAPGAA